MMRLRRLLLSTVDLRAMTHSFAFWFKPHALDDVTGNCTACGASYEYIKENPYRRCVPDGKPHPRVTTTCFDPEPVTTTSQDGHYGNTLARW